MVNNIVIGMDSSTLVKGMEKVTLVDHGTGVAVDDCCSPEGSDALEKRSLSFEKDPEQENQEVSDVRTGNDEKRKGASPFRSAPHSPQQVNEIDRTLNDHHDRIISVSTTLTEEQTVITEASSTAPHARSVSKCNTGESEDKPDPFDWINESWKSSKSNVESLFGQQEEAEDLYNTTAAGDFNDDDSMASGYSYATSASDATSESVQDIISRLQSETDRRRRRLVRRRSARLSGRKNRLEKYGRPLDPKLGITVEIQE
eukprot:256628_1